MKKTKPLSQKDKCILLFSAALFTIARVWKLPKGPSIMNKENVVYVYVFIYIYVCVCVCVCVITHI